MAEKRTGWPIYEFRPLPEQIKQGLLRCADGKWLPDDGSYDIAFGYGRGGSDNFAYGVSIPHHLNLEWGWLTTHWSARVAGHPDGNAWHRFTTDGKDFDWAYKNYNHPNVLAMREAMRLTCGAHGAANGCGPDPLRPTDPYIKAGLLRIRETGEIVKPPESLTCVYCGETFELNQIS